MNRYFQAKQDVVDACLRLAEAGFLAGIGGNLALRVSDEHFAVTPSAADYYAMQPADICILELRSLKRIEGERRPSVESGLHARLFLRRPDLAASVHTHQPVASAVALLGVDLPLMPGTETAALGARVPVTSYGPSGTFLLARAFARRLRDDCNAYLLKNHGVVCGAATLSEGIRNVELVELAAARYLRNAAGQRPTAPIVRQRLATIAP